ncbi:MAG TPA: HAMP domain-containing sensor histidine kinase [Kofleriaceae bacterium]
MARTTEPRLPAESDLPIEDRFDEDQPTPVMAVGTRDSLADQAREATRRAAVADPPREAARRPATVEDEDVASLAHDLKNPLTIIMLETTQIEQRLALRITPAVQRGLERIHQNASYIDRLISDMLDMASADAGRLELRFERIDLSRLLKDAVGRAVPTQDRHRIKLEIRDVLFVNGDEMRLERVVSNLVHNALKYAGEFGPVTVRLDRRGAYACVSVIDTGPGLTADESRVIFERYRRTSRSTSQQGYGLGLYTSRRIIEAHKGRIGIVSQPGRGSRFFFELPAVAPPAKSES